MGAKYNWWFFNKYKVEYQPKSYFRFSKKVNNEIHILKEISLREGIKNLWK